MSNISLWRSLLFVVALSCSAAVQAASCQYVIVNEWNTGFTASIIITNNSAETVNDWSVSWSYSDGSTVPYQTWNARLSGENPYVASNQSYNRIIVPNAAVNFGFNGIKGATGAPAEVPALAGICSSEPENQRPVAASTVSPMQGTVPFEVTFDAGASSDPDDDPITYLWDFGNGETSTDALVTKSFSQAGTFPVSLTVNDGQLESLPLVKTILANDGPDELSAYTLDSSQSALHFVSTKNTHIVETHHFDTLSGFISESGVATLTIDLDSVETNIDIRNERVRNLLFETSAFSQATAVLPVNLSELNAMATGSIDTQTISADVSLHGVSAVVTTQVTITKLSDASILVESVTPIIIQASMFNLTAGVDALKDIANLAVISYTVPVNFTLFFNTL